MKSIKLLAIMLILTCFLGTAYAATPAGKMTNQKPVFIENKGQWPAEVKFLAKSPGMNTWITNTGVVYDVYKYDQKQGNQNALKSRMRKDPREFVNNLPTRSGHVIKMECLKDKTRDAIQASRIDGIDMKAQNLNYFKGKDKSKWASKVPSYSEVMVNTVSQGFRTRYYFEGNKVRYDYILNPGADISNIKMNFDFGEDHQYRPELSSNGELVLKTSVGDVVHGKLFVNQNTDNNKKAEISCNFNINMDGSIGFNVGQYDKSKELIIDPLVYSTYLGGNDWESPWGFALDKDGNFIIAGHTASTDFPYTPGAYLNIISGSECFISKMDSSGRSLIFSSIFGGYDTDYLLDIALDQNENIYATGGTLSDDFPITSDAFDNEFQECLGCGYSTSDGYLLKMSAAGDELIYSTFYGGLGWDDGMYIALSKQNDVFIMGMTNSEDPGFPATDGAFMNQFQGNWDIYVMKFNQDLSTLNYCTYIGGDDYDGGGAELQVDATGRAYVTGTTASPNYPFTNNAYQSNLNGVYDVYLTILDPSGTSVVYSTFFGGSGDGVDVGMGLKVLPDGKVAICGMALSSDFPTTNNAYDQTYDGGMNYAGDGFLTIFNEDFQSLYYSTFLGGTNDDSVMDLIRSPDGKYYLTGTTMSNDFPTTSDAYSNALLGSFDIFVTVLDLDSPNLIYSTLIGGNDNFDWWEWEFGDYINLVRGDIAVGGYSTAPDFPMSSDAYDKTSAWGDAIVFKLSRCGVSDEVQIQVDPNPAITNGMDNTIYVGFGPQSLNLTATGGVYYRWFVNGIEISNSPMINISPTEASSYVVWVYDEDGCLSVGSKNINVLDFRTGNNQMYICHRGTTQRVGKSSVQSHLNHGDYLGPCIGSKEGEYDDKEVHEFSINSVSPNPFSESMIIEYTVPETGYVEIKVFDVLSNEVATIFEQSQSAGHYDVEFNGSGLVPGVYIVRIESQGKSDMMKIVKTE